jgi:hypothetical protein
MPDGLYERDILSWSEHQADLLRRLARGERVNDVDWEHVVEEIEDVGLFELHSVESFLDLILVHVLKVHGSPDSPSLGHWRSEIVAFQKNLGRRFAPSMRQRIDLEKLYSGALEQIEAADPGCVSSRRLPAACPFTLDQLLHDKWNVFEERLAAAVDGS